MRSPAPVGFPQTQLRARRAKQSLRANEWSRRHLGVSCGKRELLFHPARGIVGVGLDDAQAGTAAAAAQRDGYQREQDAKKVKTSMSTLPRFYRTAQMGAVPPAWITGKGEIHTIARRLQRTKRRALRTPGQPSPRGVGLFQRL
jgi:hypothetical protein